MQNKPTEKDIEIACENLAKALKARIKLEVDEDKVVRARPKVMNEIKLALAVLKDL